MAYVAIVSTLIFGSLFVGVSGFFQTSEDIGGFDLLFFYLGSLCFLLPFSTSPFSYVVTIFFLCYPNVFPLLLTYTNFFL